MEHQTAVVCFDGQAGFSRSLTDLINGLSDLQSAIVVEHRDIKFLHDDKAGRPDDYRRRRKLVLRTKINALFNPPFMGVAATGRTACHLDRFLNLSRATFLSV